jgi:hypothetical protein
MQTSKRMKSEGSEKRKRGIRTRVQLLQGENALPVRLRSSALLRRNVGVHLYAALNRAVELHFFVRTPWVRR